MKPKKPNQIREEARKKCAAEYAHRIKNWQDIAESRRKQVAEVEEERDALKRENLELRDQVEKLQDWNERLMEFMDIPDSEREDAVKKYFESRKADEKFRTVMDPYLGMFSKVFSMI